MEGLQGVKKVTFDAQTDDITVEYSPSELKPETLIATVSKEGYKANVREPLAHSDGTAVTSSTTTWNAAQVPEPVRAALLRAKKERKPVLLDFSAAWCGPCKRLAKETLADPGIARTLEGVVVVAVDADKDAEATKLFGVKALPHLRLLLSDGSEVGRVENFVTAEELAPLLRDLLARNQACVEKSESASAPEKRR